MLLDDVRREQKSSQKPLAKRIKKRIKEEKAAGKFNVINAQSVFPSLRR